MAKRLKLHERRYLLLLPDVALYMCHRNDFMLYADEKLTGMQVQEPVLIRADCVYVVL